MSDIERSEIIYIRSTDEPPGYEAFGLDDRVGLRAVEPGWVKYVRADTTQGAVSGVARARGLAEALAKCPDDHTVEGVREVGAEIAALLTASGGQ